MTAQEYVERVKKAVAPEEVQAIVTRAQYDDNVSYHDFIDALESAMKWNRRRQPGHTDARNVLPFPSVRATT